MMPYVIIDRLGMQHATIKANSNFEATMKYLDNAQSRNAYTNVFAIHKEDLDMFKKNIEKL